MEKKVYQVEITETLQKIIEVEADNEQDAIEQVKSDYYACDIILDDTAYIDTEITIYKEEE